MLGAGAHYAAQTALNMEQSARISTDAMERDEISAAKRAKYAEMDFRISKGYEKDNFLTRVKYFFKRA